MKEFQIPKNLEARFVNEEIGYGVFTIEPIKMGEIIEQSYCLEFDNHIGNFLDYLFKHPTSGKQLLPIGYGSIYNHNENGNIKWRPDEDNSKFIIFYATKDIKINEELCHNYGRMYWVAKQRRLV